MARNKSASSASRRPAATRSSLVEQTVQRLSRDILNGVYAPGDPIREPAVAERLGISRAPVREALRSLEQDGLVALTPWRGARVINPPPNEIADLFDMLAAVEGVVARMAVRHASDADLQRYSRIVDDLTPTLRRDHEIFELVDLSYAASGVLARSCSSSLATGMVRKLGKPAYWLHRFLLPAPMRWQQQSVAKQLKLRDLIMAREEERAERAARQLVAHTKRLILLRAEQVEAARGILQRTQARVKPQPSAAPLRPRGGNAAKGTRATRKR